MKILGQRSGVRGNRRGTHGWQGGAGSPPVAHQQAAEIPLTWLISQLRYTAGSRAGTGQSGLILHSPSPSGPCALRHSPGSYHDGPSLPAQHRGSWSLLFLLGALRASVQAARLQDADRRAQAGTCLHFLILLLGKAGQPELGRPAQSHRASLRGWQRCQGTSEVLWREKELQPQPRRCPVLYTRLVHCVHTHTHSPCALVPSALCNATPNGMWELNPPIPQRDAYSCGCKQCQQHMSCGKPCCG